MADTHHPAHEVDTERRVAKQERRDTEGSRVGKALPEKSRSVDHSGDEKRKNGDTPS